MPNYNLRKGTPQYGFFQSRAKIQIFGGAYANGKTTALAIKTLNVARDYPGCEALLARETYPKLNDTLRKVFMMWCPPAWVKKRPTVDDNTCVLINGSRVNFRYIAQRGKQTESGETTSNLLSATYDFIGIDQAEDPGITRKDFDDLIGRLRGNTPYKPAGEDDPTMPASGPRWLALTLNPSNGWAYRDLVRPLQTYLEKGIKVPELLVDPVSHEPIVELFEGDTYTNAENLPDDYIRSLEATYTGQRRERFLLGKWVAFEGLVYSDFSEQRNVITREQALAHLDDCLRRHVKVRTIEAYDFGLTNPTCYGLGFVDDFSRVILLDGFYEPDFNYTKHAAAIESIRQRYTGLLHFNEPILADPDVFRRKVIAGNQSVVGDKLSDLLRQLGMNMRPAMNDIGPGIAKVSSYISGNMKVPHIVSGELPGPLLYVCSDLDWFTDEIFSYYWKRNPQGNTTDEPRDDNDHAMDMIKYMLSRLPDASQIVLPAEKQTPAWMFWHEAEEHEHEMR